MTIWFDVDDLVAYFNANRRPSGIQRLCFQVYQAVWDYAGATGEIRFCRHDLHYTRLVEVEWPVLEQMILQVSVGQEPDRAALIRPPGLADTMLPATARSRAALPLRWLAKTLLPFELRNRMGVAYYRAPSPGEGLLMAGRAALTYCGLLSPEPAPIEPGAIDAPEPEPDLRDGDILVTLGSIWDPRFFKLLPSLRSTRRLRLATMFYDLIPIALPQFTDPNLATLFTNWLTTIIPQADVLLTISRASATDLKAAMTERGHRIPEPVILPIGASPRLTPAGMRDEPANGLLSRPYVLFVSTIEPRKNHALMLAVWARLLATMPAAEVPDLVFAGRVIGDIAATFDAAIKLPALRGKFHIIAEPDDVYLDRLYRHCRFTVFPSFYEGWGLPVTESLCYGKMVAASNRGSLPEAGQNFCAFYDPENLDEATEVIRGLIDDPARVAAYEAEIAAAFSPPSWTDTAQAMLAALRQPAPAVSRVKEVVG
jgi:glycosyltransferase involved in cell wall biosynthesis